MITCNDPGTMLQALESAMKSFRVNWPIILFNDHIRLHSRKFCFVLFSFILITSPSGIDIQVICSLWTVTQNAPVYRNICAYVQILLKVASLKSFGRIGTCIYVQIKSTAKFTSKRLMSWTLYYMNSQITEDYFRSRTIPDPVENIDDDVDDDVGKY